MKDQDKKKSRLVVKHVRQGPESPHHWARTDSKVGTVICIAVGTELHSSSHIAKRVGRSRNMLYPLRESLWLEGGTPLVVHLKEDTAPSDADAASQLRIAFGNLCGWALTAQNQADIRFMVSTYRESVENGQAYYTLLDRWSTHWDQWNTQRLTLHKRPLVEVGKEVHFGAQSKLNVPGGWNPEGSPVKKGAA
eukprot:3482881-Amphidinium_carterae.3